MSNQTSLSIIVSVSVSPTGHDWLQALREYGITDSFSTEHPQSPPIQFKEVGLLM
jgi:hypothetical protein